ncbi:MAG TPA: acyl carrier protein [Pirellulales bacterium]|jgi:acyl carrier protein|nr:acyl carrier protein [Pirellulales bacterium]
MASGSLLRPVDTNVIKEIVLEHLGSAIDADRVQIDSDLYSLGLTSLATVGLMLALEDRFEAEFAESMLGRATFRSVASIADAICKLSQ